MSQTLKLFFRPKGSSYENELAFQFIDECIETAQAVARLNTARMVRGSRPKPDTRS